MAQVRYVVGDANNEPEYTKDTEYCDDETSCEIQKKLWLEGIWY